MKVRLDHDYTSTYYLSDQCGEIVDVPDELWESYKKHEADVEFWQSKLHRIWNENRKATLFARTQSGKESVGF